MRGSIAAFLMGAGLLLSGCQRGLLNDGPTPEQFKAQAEQRQAAESAKCLSQGAKPGSAAYNQCMITLSRADAQADASDRWLDGALDDVVP